jgi:hypothetical protein
LTLHLLAVGGPDVVVGSVPLGSMLRIVRERRGLDHLASAREVLRAEPPWSFHRLGYPRPKDLEGEQLKVFQASAHLFVYELIHGKSGAPGVLRLVRELPRCWNWETALLRAFPAEFTRMLDVEKKWSVDALAFIAKDPSQVWSKVACLDRLDEVLAVAARVSVASNQLPERAWLTLQQVVSTWDTAEQFTVLRQKLSLLEVLRFHSTPEVLPLVEGYQRAISSYLQKRAAAPRTPQTRMQTTLSASLMAQDTIRELEELDDRRRALRPENVLSANPR